MFTFSLEVVRHFVKVIFFVAMSWLLRLVLGLLFIEILGF